MPRRASIVPITGLRCHAATLPPPALEHVPTSVIPNIAVGAPRAARVAAAAAVVVLGVLGKTVANSRATKRRRTFRLRSIAGRDSNGNCVFWGCSGPVGLVAATICHASTAELLPALTHVRRRKLERDLTHLFEPKEPTCRRQAGECEQLLVGDPVGVATVTHDQILLAARGERHRQDLGRVRCDA